MYIIFLSAIPPIFLSALQPIFSPLFKPFFLHSSNHPSLRFSKHFSLRSSMSFNTLSKENRIYIRGEFKESLGMNFFSPFQPEREFKVYKSCKWLNSINMWSTPAVWKQNNKMAVLNIFLVNSHLIYILFSLFVTVVPCGDNLNWRSKH